MSTLVKLLGGLVRSDTVKVNSFLVALWTALGQLDWIQSNPEYTAILGGIAAVVNILLRMKTKVPVTQR